VNPRAGSSPATGTTAGTQGLAWKKGRKTGEVLTQSSNTATNVLDVHRCLSTPPLLGHETNRRIPQCDTCNAKSFFKRVLGDMPCLRRHRAKSLKYAKTTPRKLRDQNSPSVEVSGAPREGTGCNWAHPSARRVFESSLSTRTVGGVGSPLKPRARVAVLGWVWGGVSGWFWG
jgi:hypothetical protein